VSLSYIISSHTCSHNTTPDVFCIPFTPDINISAIEPGTTELVQSFPSDFRNNSWVEFGLDEGLHFQNNVDPGTCLAWQNYGDLMTT